MPKQDLVFSKPSLIGPGMLGFAPDPRLGLDWAEFGAFITSPISMRPRTPAEAPDLLEYPGGALLHTGLPNPGLDRVLRKHASSWRQAPLPIIVSLMADRPDETRRMVEMLEGRDSILAVDLGFAPMLTDDIILLAVEHSVGEIPIIVRLHYDQVLRLGPRAEACGAAAIAIAAPRGSLARGGRLVSGRLVGPAQFPHTLELVRAAARMGVTIIGSGGVRSMADVGAMREAGALAVEYDISLWLPTAESKSPVN